jgi:hypothetical protein
MVESAVESTAREFIISASNSTTEEGVDAIESTKNSLMLRAADENDRQNWLTIVKATCVAVGGGAATPSAAAGAKGAEEGVPPAAEPAPEPASEPAPEPAPVDDLYEF